MRLDAAPRGATKSRASIAHAEMLHQGGLLAADDLGGDPRRASRPSPPSTRPAPGRSSSRTRTCHTALERRLTARIGEAGARIHLGRSRNDQVLATSAPLSARRRRGAGKRRPRRRHGARPAGGGSSDVELPGYTHLQRAMPSSVPLWAGGFAAELRDDAEGLRAVERRASRKNPLGSAAGYGVPLLPIDRDSTRRAPRLRRDPGAGHRGPALARQGRGAAPLRDRAAAPGPGAAGRRAGALRQPGVRLRGARAASSPPAPRSCRRSAIRTSSSWCAAARAAGQACLLEALAITAKLPSGYHRDLQLLKAPLFRGIDLARDTCAVVARRPRAACAFAASGSASIRSSSRPRRRTGWCSRKGSPSARPTGGSPSATGAPE